jgi:hypothetical protein
MVFNKKVLKGYYIFWIVKKNGYIVKKSSIKCENSNVLMYKNGTNYTTFLFFCSTNLCFGDV